MKYFLWSFSPFRWFKKRGWSGGAKVSCHFTGASSWYWLTVGKGLLEGECFYFFCFFTPVPLSSPFLSFILSTVSSILFLSFSERRHKMTHKGWHVIKPQHNQLIQEGQLSVSGERKCTILVNRLEDYACPVKVWLYVGTCKLNVLDMTPVDWLGCKTSTHTGNLLERSADYQTPLDQHVKN